MTLGRSIQPSTSQELQNRHNLVRLFFARILEWRAGFSPSRKPTTSNVDLRRTYVEALRQPRDDLVAKIVSRITEFSGNVKHTKCRVLLCQVDRSPLLAEKAPKSMVLADFDFRSLCRIEYGLRERLFGHLHRKPETSPPQRRNTSISAQISRSKTLCVSRGELGDSSSRDSRVM